MRFHRLGSSVALLLDVHCRGVAQSMADLFTNRAFVGIMPNIATSVGFAKESAVVMDSNVVNDFPYDCRLAGPFALGVHWDMLLNDGLKA